MTSKPPSSQPRRGRGGRRGRSAGADAASTDASAAIDEAAAEVPSAEPQGAGATTTDVSAVGAPDAARAANDAAPADDAVPAAADAASAAADAATTDADGPPAAYDAAPAEADESPAAAALQARIDALELRLERALRFVHVVLDRSQRAIEGNAALLHGLGDATVRHTAVVAAEVAAARDAYARSAPAPEFRVRVAPEVDKYQVPAVEIDCAARLRLCKAACCRKPFALSTQDLEEGVLRWDWGDPYVNLRGAGDRCVHHGDDGGCTVYEQRPLRCRRFDCRRDASIWIDFERGIPHPDLAALPTPTPPKR